jgi:hypothetical protein
MEAHRTADPDRHPSAGKPFLTGCTSFRPYWERL